MIEIKSKIERINRKMHCHICRSIHFIINSNMRVLSDVFLSKVMIISLLVVIKTSRRKLLSNQKYVHKKKNIYFPLIRQKTDHNLNDNFNSKTKITGRFLPVIHRSKNVSYSISRTLISYFSYLFFLYFKGICVLT
jgi:hypothetical protein